MVGGDAVVAIDGPAAGALRFLGVPHLVHISSLSVFADSPDLRIQDRALEARPRRLTRPTSMG